MSLALLALLLKAVSQHEDNIHFRTTSGPRVSAWSVIIDWVPSCPRSSGCPERVHKYHGVLRRIGQTHAGNIIIPQIAVYSWKYLVMAGTTKKRILSARLDTTGNTTTTAASQSNTGPFTDGESDDFEFGGSIGTALLMIGFPSLMWFVDLLFFFITSACRRAVSRLPLSVMTLYELGQP